MVNGRLARVRALRSYPAWLRQFEGLRREYVRAMAAAGVPVVAIEQVGSTSVPGLAAKPVIDCDIVVAPADVESAAAVLVGLGFRPLGELGIPQRWAFKEPARLAGTSTYVIVQRILAAGGMGEAERASIDANQVPSHEELPR